MGVGAGLYVLCHRKKSSSC